METSKLVDDLLVTLKYQVDRSPRSCFVVFSSREEHVEVVIDCVETVFQETGKYEVVRLDQHLKSGDSQYSELTDLLSSCCFAVVILDGFRPNVLFEYGILKGLGKPCIVLLDDNATVDVLGFFTIDVEGLPPSPPVDMDKHFSDVKDRFYLRYNRNRPSQIRAGIQSEYAKLEKQIEDEFLHSLFPYKEVVEKELTAHLTAIVKVFTKSGDVLNEIDVATVDLAHSHVERIADEHGVSLPQRYFSTLAHTYGKANAVDKAVAVIDDSLAGDSDDVALLADKAYILRGAGRFDEAIQALDAAIKLRPRAEFLWHNKAITLDRLAKTEEAIQCYRKAIALKSGCPSVHYHYGILLYEQKEFASALTQFKKAIELEPDDPSFLLWKARTLEASDRTAEARTIVEKLLSEDPTNANAWFVLGRIEQDATKGLECFQKAVHVDPKHGGALCSSAACLSNLGEYEEATEIFFKMAEFCPQHETCTILLYNICTTFWKIGQPEKGIERCERILSENPRHRGALAGKAACLGLMEDYKTAISILDGMMSDIPDHDGGLWYCRASICALAKDAGEATRSLRKAIALDPRYGESARDDDDFDPVRRTKVFREAFGFSTKPRPKSSASTRVRPKQTKGRKCPTKASSRRPKGRG